MYEREYYEDAGDPGSWLAKDRREADYWALEFADKEALWRTAIGGHPGRALDVGCSGGLLLEHLVGKGWVAEGIEPAVTAVAECRRLGLSVHPGLYGDIDLPEAAYDVVHARLVMEHLAFPRQFVQWAFARLRPGGVLTVQVPNEFNQLQLLARDLLGKPDWWVAPPFHLNYFTFESLERLVAAEGFELLGRDASFPVEWFLLMGDDYVGHDETGKVIHAKRMQLEAQLERAGLRAPLHAHLAAEGVGREAIVHARRPERSR
jgi:SAM-dependent methyltransferase